MPQTVQSLIQNYVVEVQKVYGSHLKQVILYGSYARGDYKPDSDVDIMILVDLSDDEITKKRMELSDITYDYNLENNLMIMPIVKNLEHFTKWLHAYPFYNNVKREGVELYVA